MPVLTAAPHIWLDEQGRPWIDETRIKVIEVVMPHLAQGWSAETLHDNYPHLSLAQIYAALGYYHDHKAEIDRQMEEDNRRAEELWIADQDSPIRRRLRALKKL